MRPEALIPPFSRSRVNRHVAMRALNNAYRNN